MKVADRNLLAALAPEGAQTLRQAARAAVLPIWVAKAAAYRLRRCGALTVQRGDSEADGHARLELTPRGRELQREAASEQAT